jgi:hypothetical protein
MRNGPFIHKEGLEGTLVHNHLGCPGFWGTQLVFTVFRPRNLLFI